MMGSSRAEADNEIEAEVGSSMPDLPVSGSADRPGGASNACVRDRRPGGSR